MSMLLLNRPNPKIDESWRGYILRLAEVNHLDKPRAILRLFQTNSETIRSRYPHWKPIAECTGKTEEQLGSIFLFELDTPFYRFMGHKIKKEFFRFDSPAVCTECVKEKGYLHARWDVEYMNACHIHRKKLLTHCPACKRKLAWYRPGLLRCRCGFDFSEQVGVEISQEEVNFIECLASIISPSKDIQQNEASRIPKPFYSMSLISFLSISNALGTRSLILNNDYKGQKRVGSLSSYTEIIRILNHWEVEFKHLLKRHMTITSSGSSSSLRKRFANIYTAFFQKDYDLEDLVFIKDSFASYAIELDDKLVLDSRVQRKLGKKVDEDLRNLGITDAAKRLNKMPSTIRKMIRNGELTTITLKKAYGNQKYVIDMDSYVEKEPNEIGELSLRKAAAYIGMPVKVLSLLRKNNIYESLHRTIYTHNWAIPDLNRLREKLESRANGLDKESCYEPVGFLKSLKNFRLGSEMYKYEVVVGVLNREIELFGSGELSELMICKTQLLEHVGKIKLAAPQ